MWRRTRSFSPSTNGIGVSRSAVVGAPRNRLGIRPWGRQEPRRFLGSTQTRNLTGCVSEDVEHEVVALVEFLLVPFVPAVRVPEEAQDPIATIVIPVVRPLNLGNNPLFPRIAIPSVVKPIVLEAVARDLGRHVRPVQVVVPVLSLRRLHPAQAQKSRDEGERLDP